VPAAAPAPAPARAATADAAEARRAQEAHRNTLLNDLRGVLNLAPGDSTEYLVPVDAPLPASDVEGAVVTGEPMTCQWDPETIPVEALECLMWRSASRAPEDVAMLRKYRRPVCKAMTWQECTQWYWSAELVKMKRGTRKAMFDQIKRMLK
jgi:hypothetical protein